MMQTHICFGNNHFMLSNHLFSLKKSMMKVVININLKQKVFLLNSVSKVFILGALYYGFWAFVYPAAWWGKPFPTGVLSSGVNWVLAPVCFLLWIIFETWAKHPEFTLKIEKETTKK